MGAQSLLIPSVKLRDHRGDKMMALPPGACPWAAPDADAVRSAREYGGGKNFDEREAQGLCLLRWLPRDAESKPQYREGGREIDRMGVFTAGEMLSQDLKGRSPRDIWDARN